jgi:type IV secretory pathway VirB10-like protein
MGARRAHAATAAAAVIAAVCLFTLAAVPARAQGPAPGPPPPGNRDPMAEARERQQREAQLRSAEIVVGAKPLDKRAAEAAAERMRGDFRDIQLLRNQVVRHLQSNRPLDYRLIADKTAEINKRAARLKSQLVREVPGGEKKEPEKPAEIADGEVTDALVMMCKRIDSFTENPVFKLPDVVDVEQSARAGRDLLEVIRLSGGLNRLAEKLDKARKK